MFMVIRRLPISIYFVKVATTHTPEFRNIDNVYVK